MLHDVSLQIGAGEAVGLVGESGSGKSMTARAVARLLPPGATTTGAIRFDGRDVAALRGGALRDFRGAVAMVFQDPRAHVNPVRTIGDFLTEALRTLRRVPPARRGAAAIEALADVGIPDGERRLRQYPHELSGGLLQRVMIAAALLAEPRLLLADEPTTALDVTTQAEVMAILDELRRERGMALLFITHDLELAGAVCDRTSVMYAGQIVETRASARLHDRPLHPYTASLGARAADDRRDGAPPDGDPGPPGAARSRRRTAARSRRAAPIAQDACRATRPPVEAARRRPRALHPRGRAARPSCRRSRAMPEPVLEATGLRKEFGDVVAVDGVDLTSRPGGSLAIVGESGLGQDDRRAHARRPRPRRPPGRSPPAAATARPRRARRKERRRRGGEVQIVFQDPYSSLDPRHSAEQAIDEVLRLHRVRRVEGRSARPRTAELGDLVGLDERQLRAPPRRAVAAASASASRSPARSPPSRAC